MRRFAAPVLLIGMALGLQGCVAAIVPLAAAGVIGKNRIDASKRAKKAQAEMAAQSEAVVEAEAETAVTTPSFLPDMSHPYASFVRYALDRVAARAAGETIRSAVLVEDVSLLRPAAIPCNDKPLAVIIDVDVSPGAAQLAQPGLVALLNTLRSADIRIAWIGQGTIAAIEAALTKANVGEPGLSLQSDAILSAPSKGPRKQEQRWAFAKGYCVLAVAGDRKSDFDELFDYLRDPTYSIGLEIFNNRGWFDVPSPLKVDVENAP